jgi:hypothetical protein
MTSTNTSSSGYIAQIQANNIVASVVGNTPAGRGYQQALTLGRIISVLEAPIVEPVPPVEPEPPVQGIPAPTNLTKLNLDFIMKRLSWTNNATGILDTLIEVEYINSETGNPSGAYIAFPHEVLGSASSFIADFGDYVSVRVSSITAAGTSPRSESILLEEST